ncbi:MAG: 1,4-dihydroxy-2-naphthoate polyprenyltransferase, partial [Planctomycetes bacterium]|nr:1,4-dihydroxy-2-naphthoate polyprenyltransferase [Planctomycetota bacterium]
MKLVPQNPGPLAIWLRATRPQTLPAALCPVLIGAAMAYRVGPLAWAVLAATFLS